MERKIDEKYLVPMAFYTPPLAVYLVTRVSIIIIIIVHLHAAWRSLVICGQSVGIPIVSHSYRYSSDIKLGS